jgi:hypothetical protein
MSEQMVGGYVNGWIADVYANVPAFFQNINLLITVQDSSTKTDNISESFALKYRTDIAIVNGHQFLAARAVPEFLEASGFVGFDEMYFIPTFYPLPKYETNKVFTTDRCNFNDSIPQSFLSIFKNCGAVRFLSDGCGLNYYCESTFATAIEEIYDDFIATSSPT